MRRLGTIVLAATLTACASSETLKPGLADANAALQAGEADKALALLSSLPSPLAGSAEAHNVRCRVLYSLDQFDAAAPECEQAVRLDKQISNYHLWLGRALGQKADQASFLTAYSLAKQARAEFEQSVELDPHNAEALADLGEFYSSAPGVVGGGTSKAEAVAAQLDKVDPARAHELRGRIAGGNKDYVTAEREFKQAIAVSPHPAFQWSTLASFYRRREAWTEMDLAVQNVIDGVNRDPRSAVALYNGASVLMKAKRNPALAVKMLEMYVSSPTKTEEAPAFVAHVKLARLKLSMGDTLGAERERAAALALANGYRAAQDIRN